MIRTRSIKSWIVVLQLIVIFAGGHAAGIFAVLEFWGISELFTIKGPFEEYQLAAVITAVLTFCGQVLILFSSAPKTKRAQASVQIAGTAFLWLAIIAFAYSNQDSGFVLVWVTVIPLAIATIISIIGRPLGRIFTRMWYAFRG